MSGENWFSFSEDSGFQRHASAEDARAEAQRALDYDESEAGCDGWPEGTDRICWGEVREAAIKTDTHRHGPDCRPDSDDDGDDDTCTEGYSLLFDHICEFNMTPTVPPGEIDALRTRAEAAEAEVARVVAERDEARDDAELERGRVAALEACVATGNGAISEAHAEVARLRAELAQARADAEALAVAARGWADQLQAARLSEAELDALDALYDRVRATGLTGAEVDALDALYNRLCDLPDAEMVAAIRRALGGAR